MTRSLVGVAVLLVLVGCQDGTTNLAAESSAPLLNARSFAIRLTDPASNEPLQLERVFVGAGDPKYQQLFDDLVAGCRLELQSRFLNATSELSTSPYEMGGPWCSESGALAQQIRLCLGHRFLTMAEAVSEIAIMADGSLVVRTPDDGETREPRYVLPPPSTSDAATLALVAVQSFQWAALHGADLVNPNTCEDGSLAKSVGSGPDEAPLALVVASATAEALNMLGESSQKAKTNIEGAAQGRLSHERDEVRARVQSWRGQIDSRLEVANFLVGVPPRMFEPLSGSIMLPDAGVPDAGMDGGTMGMAEAAGEYTVCDREPLDLSEEFADRLLRDTRIDPRLPDAELTARLAEALTEDYPGTLGGLDPASPGVLESLGVSTPSLRTAAARLVKESAALGRPLVTISDGDPSTVDRVAGTAPSVSPVEPAFLLASTTGSGRFDEIGQWLDEGHTMADVEGDAVLMPPRAYGQRSVMATFDYVGAALELGAGRADMSSSSGPAIQAPGALLLAARILASEQVPLRLEACIGQASPDVARVRVRLHGVGENGSRYSLWWKETGLQCGTRGNIEGVPCEPEEHRIDATGTVRTGGGESGLGPRFVEWLVEPDDVPGVEDTIPTEARIYVLERVGDGRTLAVAGFAVMPGPHAGTEWSRCVQMPAGHEVGAAVAESLAPSPDGCWEPANTCAGLPRDLRLPLEDEISEAGEGRDEIESSFLHYLRLARQAADEADVLGEQLIEQGLQMDVRAEAARDELEALCGGVVNVDAIPVTAANSCDCGLDMDGTPITSCPDPGVCDGLECRAGVCAGARLTDYLDDSPDLDSIRRCLGDTGELVDAALGEQALCRWQRVDPPAPPCVCDDTDCPPEPCPALVPAGTSSDTGCVGRWGDLPAGYMEMAPTLTMGLTAVGRSGSDPPACLDLARVRSRVREGTTTVYDADVLERVVAQEWLDHEPVKAIAEAIGYKDELFRFAELRRAGRQWVATGTEAGGPSAAWPCSELASLDADVVAELCDGSVPSAGRSLLCGAGACGTAEQRITSNARLFDAAYALHALTGASLEDLEVSDYASLGVVSPWYPRGSGYCETPGQSCEGDTWVRCTTEHREVRVDCESCDLSRSAPCAAVPLLVGTARNLPAWFLTAYPEISAGQVFPHTSIPGLECVGALDPDQDGLLLVPDFAAVAGDNLCPIGHRTKQVTLPSRRSPTDMRDLAVVWSRTADGSNVRQMIVDTYNHTPSGVPFWTWQADLPRLGEYPSSARITNGQVWDALELACIGSSDDGGGCGAQLDELPEIRSVDDFPRLKRSLQCAASRFEGSLDRLVLVDLPEQLVQDLRSGSISATFPSYRGDYGKTVAELRAALEGIVRSTRSVATNLRDFGGELSLAQSRLRTLDLEDEIDEWSHIRDVAAQATACLESMKLENLTGWGSSAVCINAGVQIALAVTIRELRGDILTEQQAQVLTDVAMMFSTRMDMLDEATRNLAEHYANANRLLAQLDQQRSAARRAAARVLFLDRDDVGREYNVNRVMRLRMNTLKERYERAKRNAIRYSYIARRAIEQRFAVDLSRMSDDMTLVPPPATWADSLCEMDGIDYDRISDVDIEMETFSDGYIGDYVTLLENFVESYRFDFPFTDAQDVAVLSLRDDIHTVRRECDVEGHNLLLWSSDLSRPGTDDLPGWRLDCVAGGTCLAAMTVPDAPFRTEPIMEDMLGSSLSRQLGGARAFRMERTEGSDPAAPDHEPGWYQEITLPAGDFLLSWYEKADSSVTSPQIAAFLDGSIEPPTVSSPDFLATADRWMASGWRRAYLSVHSRVDQDVVVRFELSTDGTGSDGAVVWSAPQLEQLAPDEVAASIPPRAFFPTGDTRYWPVGWCEDTDGSMFRSTRYWTRGCELLCPDGFGERCTGGSAGDSTIRRCFWETSFNIALDDIERGDLIPTGSLALGNFNYRHHTFGLNLVGVGVRDCSLAEVPSACYASAFVPFSLRHDGPYRVRNHVGEVYEAPLYVGKVEQAKALVAERYLTNPVSSADRALLTDYLRRELRGRPIEGHYRLRIFDAPGFDFSRVEDVQVILNYKYWTRFE